MITQKFYPRFEWSDCTGFVDFLYGLAVPLDPWVEITWQWILSSNCHPLMVALAIPRLFMLVEVSISLLTSTFDFCCADLFFLSVPRSVLLPQKNHLFLVDLWRNTFQDIRTVRMNSHWSDAVPKKFQPLHCSRTGLLKQIVCSFFSQASEFSNVSCRFPVSGCLYMGRAWNLQDFWSPMPSVEMVCGPLICRSRDPVSPWRTSDVTFFHSQGRWVAGKSSWPKFLVGWNELI